MLLNRTGTDPGFSEGELGGGGGAGVSDKRPPTLSNSVLLLFNKFFFRIRAVGDESRFRLRFFFFWGGGGRDCVIFNFFPVI